MGSGYSLCGWANETDGAAAVEVSGGIKEVTVRCRDKEGEEEEVDHYVIVEAVKEEEEEGEGALV